MQTDRILVEARDLRTYCPIKTGVFQRTVARVRAVDGVPGHEVACHYAY